MKTLPRKSQNTVNSSATAEKTSAENSISSFLSNTLHHDQQLSTLDERNLTTTRPNLFHSYKIQVQVKIELHAKNMKQYDDDYDVYKYCELLNTRK
jgi:hypothetical protein